MSFSSSDNISANIVSYSPVLIAFLLPSGGEARLLPLLPTAFLLPKGEEKDIYSNLNDDPFFILDEEIRILKIRQYRMLKRIKDAEAGLNDVI
jgi:hypothetical protein